MGVGRWREPLPFADQPHRPRAQPCRLPHSSLSLCFPLVNLFSEGPLAAAFPEVDRAWQLKEALRTWYATAEASTAAAGLDRWMAAVKGHGPTELRKALSAIRLWRREILAFFDFLPTRLSNGFVEGKNNRTKALMRQGYGYPNRRHLRLRILLEVAS